MYALELLTVYAWEQGCGAENFDIVEGIRTVLGLIKQQEQLCVYWIVNYNFENETVRNILLSQLRSSRYQASLQSLSLPVSPHVRCACENEGPAGPSQSRVHQSMPAAVGRGVCPKEGRLANVVSRSPPSSYFVFSPRYSGGGCRIERRG